MNSLALFRFPLKVGHVPKRLAGVAIVGGLGIGLSGGIGEPGLLGSGDSSSGSLVLSGASSNSSSKGSVFFSSSGSSFNFPCATKGLIQTWKLGH
jgi:hypothetical protein